MEWFDSFTCIVAVVMKWDVILAVNSDKKVFLEDKL